MNFTGKRKILFTIPAIIIIIGIISTIVMGFNLDIDFSGGTEITISMGDKEYSDDDVKTTIEDACGHDVSTVQKMDNGGVLVKLTDYLKDDENKSIKDAFKEKYGLEDGAISITAVSATIGNEMVGQSILLCIITVILMLAYITIRFEFKFGLCSVIALIHDVLIMLTFYVVFRIPVNTSFIAAILTIIGYSINATIIVFDRIRENLRSATKKTDIDDLTNKSIKSTITRSINTSVTSLITIVVIYAMRIESLDDFTLPLMVGIIAGAYSSVFIAGPMWALLKKGKKATAK